MRHGAVTGQGSIFERPKVWQPRVDEIVQSREGLGAGSGETARAIVSDQVNTTLTHKPVEVPTHFLIDVVLCGRPRVGQAETDRMFRGRLPIVMIKVEAPTLRLRAAHEYSGVRAHVSVELFHHESGRGPAVRPAGEVLLARHETPTR